MTQQAKRMGLGEFLGHKTGGGGGGSFLKNWKNRDDHAINVVLHTMAGFLALWQHPLPRLNNWEDKDGKAHVGVWNGSWNCIEPERILREQHRRDKKTGERKSPPTTCPFCRLVERVRLMVEQGELGFTQPLFQWEGDDPDETVVLHAGGVCNLFAKKDLDKEQVEEMRKAKLYQDETWAENCHSKCNYVFVVVDVDNPGDGIQIAVERTLLGDKVKECVAGQMIALGEDDGNPIKNPYAIRWIHQKDEKEFGKKYKAIAMPKLQLSEEVRRLIFDVEPPEADLEKVSAPGNPSLLRAQLEEHCLVDFGKEWWDELFDGAEGGAEPEAESEAEAEQPIGGMIDPEPEAEVGSGESEGYKCDRCDKMMSADEYTCPHCGAEYDRDTGKIIPEKPKEEPKPAPKTRSQAKAEPPAPKDEPKPKPAAPKPKPAAPKPKPAEPSAKRSVAGKGYPTNPKDKVPF